MSTKKLLRRLLVGLLFFVIVPATNAVSKSANGRSQNTHQPKVINAVGRTYVDGHPARVDITLRVHDGANEQEIVSETLAGLGAQWLGEKEAEFVLSGLRWRRFIDTNPGNDFVLQSYNSLGQPASGDYLDAFLNAQRHWNEVSTATFALRFGGLTTRCPSMVTQCPTGRKPDGFNDVGWVELDPQILALTFTAWFASTGFIIESDVALNPGLGWFIGDPPHDGIPTCDSSSPSEPPPPGESPPPPPANEPPPPPGGLPPPPFPPAYDAQTTLLHENGHVAGLGHSLYCEAVMWCQLRPYQTRRKIADDDSNAISQLYPLEFVPLPFEAPIHLVTGRRVSVNQSEHFVLADLFHNCWKVFQIGGSDFSTTKTITEFNSGPAALASLRSPT